MKEVIIDGHVFNNLAGFYDEIQRKFCRGLKIVQAVEGAWSSFEIHVRGL